jgi:putative ABC transport system permease protein
MDSPIQLLWGLGLLGVTIAIALWQRLDQAIGLATAGLRAVLQMFVFSYLVALVIELQNPWVSLGAVLGLLGMAAVLVQHQVGSRLPIGWLAAGSLLVGVGSTVVYSVLLVLQPQPWYDGRVLVPIVSVVLANAMAGAGIAAERLIQGIDRNPGEIELRLSLGASVAAAIQPYRQEAMKAAVIPMISSWTVMGLGSMPLVQAGGLLAGFDPLQAGAYQLLVSFMSGLAMLVAVLGICGGIRRLYFTAAGQLLRW